jgi:hypothetical protein
MAKKITAVHLYPDVRIGSDGKFERYTQHRSVRVLAVAEGWAMVRVKGCSTYAAPLKQIQFDEKPTGARHDD